MASRTMHLAMAKGIAEEIVIQDMDRFRLGSILPDAYAKGMGTAVGHFKTKFDNGTKVTYRLNDFRQKYGEKMLKDDLYLGYYMHLIQDILYRHFVYDIHHWDPRPEGNVGRLHNDYSMLNLYVIHKYDLPEKLVIPIDIEKEELLTVYPFGLEQLKKDFKFDFLPVEKEKAFFFTEEMADTYITDSVKKCIKEIKALRDGSYLIDEIEYAWKAH